MPTTSPTLAPGEATLARATLYRLLAQAFRHPGPGWGAEWDELARGTGAALEVLAAEERERAGSEPCPRTAPFDAWDLAWAASRDLAALRGEHARLIGHSPRAGATPYETEWTGSAGEILQFHLLADLAGFYRAFGLELAPGCDERADHLALELCFLAYLCVKEARAEEEGRVAEGEIVRAGQRRFLEDHLLGWTRSFCARLERDGPGGFYGHAGRLLASFLGGERRRFGLPEPEGLRELAESSLALEDCCVGCDQARGCAGPVAHLDGPR